MKTWTAPFVRLALFAAASTTAACDLGQSPSRSPDSRPASGYPAAISASGEGGAESEDDQPPPSEPAVEAESDGAVRHWSYARASAAFDLAVVPTVREVAGLWKTSAWAHSKSGNLALSPAGINAGSLGYQETYAFAVSQPTCVDSYSLELTRTWREVGEEPSVVSLDLGENLLEDDAIPENLALGPKGQSECRYLGATDDAPEHLLCWTRGISSGSVTYTCLVRSEMFDKQACQF